MPDGSKLSQADIARLSLYLLGMRKQRAARKRRFDVSTRELQGHTLNRRFVRLVCRWSIAEYPGYIRAFASLLGLQARTAKAYLTQRNRLPLKHAIRLLELGRQYEAEWRSLNADLEAYVAERSQPKARKRRGGKTG